MNTAKLHRSGSASEVVSGSDSDTDSSDESGQSAAGGYAEGRISREAEAEADGARKTTTALCPIPVRVAVGVFSTLAAVAGASMAIYGGNELNHPGDPQADVHRVMLGIGFAALGLGACGALTAFIRKDKDAFQAHPA